MVGSRTLTASVGLLASLAVSAAAWLYFDTLLLFLFVPFVPLLFGRRARSRRQPARECPECGFRTRDRSAAYCPYDGTELTEGDPEEGESRPAAAR